MRSETKSCWPPNIFYISRCSNAKPNLAPGQQQGLNESEGPQPGSSVFWSKKSPLRVTPIIWPTTLRKASSRMPARLRCKHHCEQCGQPFTSNKHDPEKWVPVFRKRSCAKNKIERDDDSKKRHLALGLPAG